jgi:putative spermidine/putrescine transport system permease protein
MAFIIKKPDATITAANLTPLADRDPGANRVTFSDRRRDWINKGADKGWGSLYPIAVVLGCLFILAPVTVIVLMSLSAAPSIVFPPPSLTLRRFTEIQPEIVNAFINSTKLGVTVVVVNLAICVPAAFSLVRGRLPMRGFMTAIARSPMQVPGIAMAVAFYLYYTTVQRTFHIPLRNNFWGLVIAHLVMTAPYMLTTLIAQLYTIQGRFEQAAHGLGAGPIRTLWRVTLPQIRPSIIAGSFLAFVISFEDVPVALFLAPAASATTLPVQMFNLANDSLSPTLFAASVLVLLFSVVLVLAVERLVGLKRALTGI